MIQHVCVVKPDEPHICHCHSHNFSMHKCLDLCSGVCQVHCADEQTLKSCSLIKRQKLESTQRVNTGAWFSANSLISHSRKLFILSYTSGGFDSVVFYHVKLKLSAHRKNSIQRDIITLQFNVCHICKPHYKPFRPKYNLYSFKL